MNIFMQGWRPVTSLLTWLITSLLILYSLDIFYKVVWNY
jgi:hypothetical protein